MTKPAATIVVPLDLRRRTRELLHRAQALLAATAASGLRLVLALAPCGGAADAALEHAVAAHAHASLVRDAGSQTPANLSRLRNLGTEAAAGGTLVFVDADIVPDAALLRALVLQVAAGAVLAMAPCLYLSREGTTALQHNRKSAEELIGAALAFEPEPVLHWAMPSSVMAVRAADVAGIGGFHEGYCGHGYEDLDFMIRLALSCRLVQPSQSLLVDRPYRAPLLAEGFRAHLGALCIGNLLDGHIALHLHHAKPDGDPYLQLRARNARLFAARLSALVSASGAAADCDPVPPIVTAFYAACASRGRDPKAFHALFDARPRARLVRRPLPQLLGRGMRNILRKA